MKQNIRVFYWKYIFPIGLFIRNNIYSNKIYNNGWDKIIDECVRHNEPFPVIQMIESFKR